MIVTKELIFPAFISLAVVLMSFYNLEAQQEAPSMNSKIKGMLVGSAIGDAAGGPVEFVDPPLRSFWTTCDQKINIEGIKELGKLFKLRPYPKDVEPFAQWEPFGPEGTITDDTRFKLIFFNTLKNYEGELTMQNFARSVLDFRQELPDKYRDNYDRWIPEIEYATNWALGKKENAYPPERIWGGIPTMEGQMPFLPVAALNPHDPEWCYLKSYELGYFDNGIAKDINSALVAGLARALQSDGNWMNFEEAMRTVDPYKYNEVLYVDRQLIKWLDLSHQLVKRSEGNIASLFVLLEENLETVYWWEAWVPIVVVMACAEIVDYDPLASMQLMIEFGHDTDSYAQVMGAVMGAIHGREAWPEEMRATVNHRMKEQFNQNVDDWMTLINQSGEGTGQSTEKTTDRLAIAKEMEEVLTTGMMDFWYPRCVDKEFGGYLSNFDKEWKQMDRQPKFIVTQARHTWASAQMYKMYPEKKVYREVSEHGYKFLRDVMWDKEYGGYYTLTKREGEVTATDGTESTKIAYGNAFVIYGLAAYFEVSNDSSALDLAIRSFYWLDKHSHDPEFGGYFQFLERDGTPMVEGRNGTPPKDQNSSIHILEGYTELYKVWKNEHLKNRINEMLVLIRDTIATEKGYMNLFFHRDWTPVLVDDEVYPGGRNEHQFDYISFGHDIETAYLLLEAAEAIGLGQDKTTHRVSKTMTDHTLKNGWDPVTGATYEAGFYFEGREDISILEKYTQWWAATESFHTLLLMSGLYPDDPMNYFDKFTLTWDYCKQNLIDQERGGWYRLGINESPESANGNKGGIWKGNYHNARSLINCIIQLRKTE